MKKTHLLFAVLFLGGLAGILYGIHANAERLYKTTITRDQVLRRALYDEIRARYVWADGRVVSDDDTTSSESQSYIMLMAVFSGDRATFDTTWSWTQKNMQVRSDHLLSWLWADGGLKDINAATDADQDIALALLLAADRWDLGEYREVALAIITDIWNFETYAIADKRYILAGPYGFVHRDGIITNPSYFAPYAYREFARVDPSHDWHGLIDNGYTMLIKCSQKSGLARDWCKVDPEGNVVPGYYSSGLGADIHSYDALRVPYRIAIDYFVSRDQRALAYLDQMKPYKRDWENDRKIYTVYGSSGEPLESSEFLAMYGAALAAFSALEPRIADEIFLEKIAPVDYGTVKNLYSLSWLWFGLHAYGRGWWL